MKSISEPHIPQDLVAPKRLELSDGAHITESLFSNLQLSHQTAKSVSIEGSRFELSEISSSKLRSATITDVVFDSCMLFATDLDESGWQRVRVDKGMMSGLVLSATSLKDITFTGVKMDLANFRFAKLKQVKFEDCDLTEADFQSTEMHDVTFRNCKLHKAVFAQCKLNSVDLRGSRLDEVKGLQSLRGAIISSSQLFEISHDLAADIGIKVSDE